MNDVEIDPVSFDNNTLPKLTASEAAGLGGLYQYDPLFYHKTFDRFVPWEDVKLALIHMGQEKKYLWYLVEMNQDDVNSPIIYARSKFRRQATYRSPWTSVTPGGLVKARELPSMHLITAWDAFRFDTPVKWGASAAIVILTGLWWKFGRDTDDD